MEKGIKIDGATISGWVNVTAVIEKDGAVKNFFNGEKVSDGDKVMALLFLATMEDLQTLRKRLAEYERNIIYRLWKKL